MSSSLIARTTCWETKSVRQVPQNAVWWRGMPITALFEHLRQRINCTLPPLHPPVPSLQRQLFSPEGWSLFPLHPPNPASAKTAAFPLPPGHHWPDLDAIIVSKRIIFGDQIVAPNNQNTLRQQRQLLQQIFD